jgi:hypothetical protein
MQYIRLKNVQTICAVIPTAANIYSGFLLLVMPVNNDSAKGHKATNNFW